MDCTSLTLGLWPAPQWSSTRGEDSALDWSEYRSPTLMRRLGKDLWNDYFDSEEQMNCRDNLQLALFSVFFGVNSSLLDGTFVKFGSTNWETIGQSNCVRIGKGTWLSFLGRVINILWPIQRSFSVTLWILRFDYDGKRVNYAMDLEPFVPCPCTMDQAMLDMGEWENVLSWLIEVSDFLLIKMFKNLLCRSFHALVWLWPWWWRLVWIQ